MTNVTITDINMNNSDVITTEQITLAAGCFWCIESAFNQLKGINSAISGYMGGKTLNPTYQDICTGTTEHAEVVQVSFSPEVIRIETLLEVFFALHDPTQLNRQGNDVGTQYRSAIFYHSSKQEQLALKAIKNLTEKNTWSSNIVTEVTAVDTFYHAENYHQDYVSNNTQNPYCQMLVLPKLRKFRENFSQYLK
jgi:peptide-methionine (S)-S-oxide reductase